MLKLSKRWSGDSGSVDFVQLVIGMFIVALACAGTFKAIQFGNDHLKKEMRYRQAMCVARSYMEYWQGRVNIYLPNDNGSMQGTLNRNVEQVLLDAGNPEEPGDEVYGMVRYGEILAKRSPQLGTEKDSRLPRLSHYVLSVTVTWHEPDEPANITHEVLFKGAMITS